MVSWNNLDTLSSYKELADVKPACLTEVMSGDNGAERVKNYSIQMCIRDRPESASISYIFITIHYTITFRSSPAINALILRYISSIRRVLASYVAHAT